MTAHRPEYTGRSAGVRVLRDWERHLVPEAGRWPNQTVLEIGVGEGRSAAWFLEHVLPLADARYIGIDPWGDSRRWKRAEDRCRRNLAPHREKVRLYKGRAEDVLPVVHRTVHLCYVDAAKDTISVAFYSALVWPKVAVGGLVIWNEYRHTQHNTVQRAVDKFLTDHPHDVVWAHSQLCVRIR